jgi:Icc protein
MLIAQLTDIHLMAEPHQTLRGMNTQQSLDRVLEQIQSLPELPQMLILTGDLANDGDISAYHRLRHRITALGIPTYSTAGNHDLIDRLVPHLTNNLIHYIPRLELNNWQFLFLDSTVPDQIGGAFSPSTLHWLEQTLTDCRLPTLIAFHHPALDLDSAWIDSMGLANKQEFWQICQRFSHVRLVMNGHAHQENIQVYQGITCVVTPSTCMQFLPKTPTYAIDVDRPPGFRLVRLAKDGTFTTEVIYTPTGTEQF